MSKLNEAFQKYLIAELEMKECQAAMKHAFKRLKGATNLEDQERFLERCIVTKAKFDSCLLIYFESEKIYQKEIEEVSKRVREFESKVKDCVFLKDTNEETLI